MEHAGVDCSGQKVVGSSDRMNVACHVQVHL